MPLTRAQLLKKLFPGGIPGLWCPRLTHYDSDGRIDKRRMKAHLQFLLENCQAFLVPGSTGDGWELDEEQQRAVIDMTLSEGAGHEVKVLIGVLKSDTNEAIASIRRTLTWLRGQVPAPNDLECLIGLGVCGFTICPPKGPTLTQEQIAAGLASVLDLGLPCAIYQLPQVTQNLVLPETMAKLAQRYANFIMFKDSGGKDEVVLSGELPADVFTMRGAEGMYSQWTEVYDGLLLSTANCFPEKLDAMANSVHSTANLLENSERLTKCVREVFALVEEIPQGNAFTNANKAMDYFMAFGPGAIAAKAPAPRLRAGGKIPMHILEATGDALYRYKLMPMAGYVKK